MIAKLSDCKRLEIVVPTHGRPDRLRAFLEALAPQVRSANDSGLIIVNDGSHDGAYERSIAPFADVMTYVPLPVNRGPANARNEGARRASAEFVAFTDDDCRPPSHWLDWLIALIETLPAADVIGGPTQPPEPTQNAGAVERFNRAYGLYPRPLFSKGELCCMPSANVAVRRDLFLAAGGFDEEFRYAAGEDLNLFYRLKRDGARFHLDRNWYTTHPVDDTLRIFVKRWYRYGYGTAQHCIRSDDPSHRGFSSTATAWTILRSVPKHLRYMKKSRLQQGKSDQRLTIQSGGFRWEPLRFAGLAALQHIAHQFGAQAAFRTERSVSAPTDAGPAAATIARPVSQGRAALPPYAAPAVISTTPTITSFGIIIGAMKCGTSALFQALADHPEVALSKVKEPHFFSTKTDFAKGPKYYFQFFECDPARHRIMVEASTRYTMLPAYKHPARRMFRTGWDFRFVYLVRDPVERIRAHYLNAAIHDFGLNTFPVEVSRYHTQLEPYREAFGRDSILVLSHDAFVADPMSTMGQVCDHFRISRRDDLKVEIVHDSEYQYRRGLLLARLRTDGRTPPSDSIGDVPALVAGHSAEHRQAIDSEIEWVYYTLKDAQKAEIRRELADEMRLLYADYGIDVTKWGFAPLRLRDAASLHASARSFS